ncbi:TetR/AcrR family transcriptional regulator [Salinarimonas rosea]|uniref:TetR/AcrR family transcriptional regulator n=1 Tax=Salinarimonas rosea TaxID=552063 RepID=UPI0004061E63|nr:TetR/AcrR family transcriptional regulator [Salinarimonas rosea]
MDGEPRKRRRRKDARPAEIVEAGFAEFAEKGFASARLEDVAARAGIAKPTIYLYFPSKEALFEAVVRSRIVSAMDGFDERAATFQGSSRDLIALILSGFYERLIGGGAVALFRIIVAEGPRHPGLLRFYREEALSRLMAVLGRVLERGVARGEIRPGPASREPRVVMAPALVAALWLDLFQADAPLDRDAYLAAHIDLVLDGLSVEHGSAPS